MGATKRKQIKPKPKDNKDQRGEKGLFAPGNQFWQIRSKHGRDKLFKTPELLLEAACEYFQWCIDNPFYEVTPMSVGLGSGLGTEIQMIKKPVMRPFTIQGLVGYLGASAHFLDKFEEGLKEKTDKESTDFLSICTRIREIIYNQKFSGAASGFFNPNIIARDLGLADVQKQAVTIDSEKKIELKIDGENIDLSK